MIARPAAKRASQGGLQLLRTAPLLLSALFVLAPPAIAAEPDFIYITHTFHHYAGGGACIERFLIERETGLGSELDDLRLSFEFRKKTQSAIQALVEVKRLGSYASDNWTEATVEVAQCPDLDAELVMVSATARVGGKVIDLMASGAIKVRNIQTFTARVP